MSRDFREIFARYWKPYQARYGKRLPQEHRKAAEAILGCRTAAMGGALYRCEDCGSFHYHYHSCNHRLCPQCGYQDSMAWAQRQEEKLLPVPYSMVTFTVPQALRKPMRSHQKKAFGLLFRCSAQALQEVAADAKYLGGSLGMFGILHTWTRQLQYHPHIHYIVPEGGLTKDGVWVRPKSTKFFLPVKRLSIVMRMAMEKAFRTELPELYQSLKKSIWREQWVVHIQKVGSGEKALRYLARYVNQTALSSKRITDEGDQIRLRYIESGTNRRKSIRLKPEEFMRRFMQHVLPSGFKRVRYYGWLSPAAHKRLARIQALLDWKPKAREEAEKEELLCQKCEGILRFAMSWHRGRGPPMALEGAIALEAKEGTKKDEKTN